MRYLLVFLTVVLIAQFVSATTIHVPADQPTIQAGIDAAVDGDTVMVGPGTYSEHLYIDKTLTILSESGSDATIINGGGLIQDTSSSTITIIDANQIIIAGFSIKGGRGLMTSQMDCARGGGIFVLGTRLFVEDCIITDNSAAIIDLDDQVVGGGGIFADSTARLTIMNTEITSNSVYEDVAYHNCGIFGGGGIMAICDSVKIIQCEIKHNSIYSGSDSSALGGGLLICGDFCSISGCAIDSNSATHFNQAASGGGIYIMGLSNEITECQFAGNIAHWNGIDGDQSGANGGGIYSIGDSLRLRKSIIIENQALSNGIHGGSSLGGGLYIAGNSLMVDSNLITYCSSTVNIPSSTSHTGGQAEGGGLYMIGSGSLTYTTVSGNRCVAYIGGGETVQGSSSGGGCHVRSGIFVQNCTYYDNHCYTETAGGDSYEASSSLGGGIFGTGDISKSIIDSCTASAFAQNIIPEVDGGGVFTTNNDPISCSDFWNNVPNHVSGEWSPATNMNIIANPLYCPDSSDFAVYDVSPCIPENNDCGEWIGAFEIDCAGKPIAPGYGIADEEENHVIDNIPVFWWGYSCPLGNPEDSFNIAVGTDNDWQYAEMWNPAPFPGPDTSVTYAGAALVDGETYYLRLRVHNGLAWSDWYEMYFRMNSVPSVPVPLSPVNDAVVNSSTISLYVLNSNDAEGDALSYGYMLWDYVFNDTMFSSLIPEETDSTAFTIDNYADNYRFWWCSRAHDGYEYSGWCEPQTFWVNGTEENPTDFDLIYPPDTGWSQVYDFPTIFMWHESYDPDPMDSIFYRLLVSIDSDFTFVATYDSLYESCCAIPGFGVMVDLDYNEHYWWKVYAIDTKGNMTQSSGVADFMTWVLGDANADFSVSVGDAVFLINYIFKGGEEPDPLKIGDVNATCAVDVADVVYLISYIFRGGQAPMVGCVRGREPR